MRRHLLWASLALLVGCGSLPEPTAEDQRLVDAWLDPLEEDLDYEIEGAILECEAREQNLPSPYESRRERGTELSRQHVAASDEASRGVQRRIWLRFSPVFNASGRLSERAGALWGQCQSRTPPPSADVRRELEGLRRTLDEAIHRSVAEVHLEPRPRRAD